MGGNSHRGMGITAMFHGPSGTGKTTAAEIIARELQIDLYRVDLSQVSNKYIGETEKNLAKVFDMAESSGALLLFDEADSIIGKRSEVKESKDRYANQEVGYLLQRMEAYSGVAILTTNLPNAIDSAFMRRIKYSIRFEYPNQEQRAMIWGKAFPPKAPKESLPPSLLAQLNISGASIRSIALSAAFLAATEKSAISMEHVLRATRAEYQKQGRKLTDREVQGWNQRAAVSSQ
jgi:SpoVK/Ycf46/Vps4 family AAA+-type ATPase